MDDKPEETPVVGTSTPELESLLPDVEVGKPTVGELLEKLSASELILKVTAEVVAVIQNPTSDKAERMRAWSVYGEAIEKVIESIVDRQNPKLFAYAQIIAIMHKSLIFQQVGNTMRYLEELDRAEVYAYNLQLDDISESIQGEINALIEPLTLTTEVLLIRLKGVISEMNREFLRDLIDEGIDLQDMIGNVYDMILDEGGDPDQFFADIGDAEH